MHNKGETFKIVLFRGLPNQAVRVATTNDPCQSMSLFKNLHSSLYQHDSFHCQNKYWKEGEYELCVKVAKKCNSNISSP